MVATIVLVVLMCCGGSFAYSVLTHEEIVDLLWTGEIRPLLLKRYPGLSEDQITEAHAYACGGAVIQDLGPELRSNVLGSYSDRSAPIKTKKDGAQWQALLTDLDQLKSAAPAPTRSELPSTIMTEAEPK